MKLLRLLLLGLLLVVAASAQTATNLGESSDVTVTRFSWHKDVYIPALYDDPMSPNQEQADLKREQKAISKANVTRVQQGQTPLPLPTREIVASRRDIPPGPSVNYVYEAKVKNAGEKTIKMIVWEYLIFDPQTKVQVGHHNFTDTSKIRAGKTANLIGYTASPPALIIEAKKVEKESSHKYAEQVVINRIEYDDGSFWQRPD